MIRPLLLALVLVACAPITPPPPGPGPSPDAAPVVDDLLMHAVFDCRAEWVESERANIAGDVSVCLAGDVTAACLVSLARNLAHPDTVGCEARDRMGRACAAVAVGGATVVQDNECRHGRKWILDEGVSYR